MRTPEEIDEVLNNCMDKEEVGETAYPGMSYEQGVKDGVTWTVNNPARHDVPEGDFPFGGPEE